MFNSFGKASSTKTSVNDRPSRGVENESDVQVEVSLDVFDKLYSIVVTENASLQSVLSVATAETLNRDSKNQKIKKVTSSRSSGARNSETSRARSRESSSCPPPMNRGSSEKTMSSTSSHLRSRESSCPPSISRPNEVGTSPRPGNKSVSSSSIAGKKSKDLVSQTALRNRRGFFGTRRKSQKVVPATGNA